MKLKYIKIYDELVKAIEDKEVIAGEKLPSENELMEQYQVSRDTIRKSLDLLEENGYIQKAKGKGSFVLDIDKFDFPVSGIISFKEISEKLGHGFRTIVEHLELRRPDKTIEKRLELSQGDLVWEVIRVREIDGERIILDKDYFHNEYIKGLTKEICEDSTYEYIENELGLSINFAKKEIVVEKATEEDRKYLDLESFDMVVVVKSYTYLSDASLFQYTESRHRPDKFKFVDFARRKH